MINYVLQNIKSRFESGSNMPSFNDPVDIACAGGTALVGWWWLDPAFALLMVPWLIKEGLEGIRGDACFDGAVLCFCRECWFGSRDCPASCCAVAA